MDTQNTFDIFIVASPGLEDILLGEVIEKGFTNPVLTPGGITIQGGWPDVWRANLELRGASRVLARIGSFMAFHLAQLDKRSRKFPWAQVLRPDIPLRVQVTTKASPIYHAGATKKPSAKHRCAKPLLPYCWAKLATGARKPSSTQCVVRVRL